MQSSDCFNLVQMSVGGLEFFQFFFGQYYKKLQRKSFGNRTEMPSTFIKFEKKKKIISSRELGIYLIVRISLAHSALKPRETSWNKL